MFCPSCGTENTGLPYCNRCGANLGQISAPTQIVEVNVTKPALILALTLIGVTLGGFGALVGGALSLATVVHGNDPLIAVIFMGMLVILIVDIFLARQLSKIITASISSPTRVQPNSLVGSNRPQIQIQQPSAGRLQPAASVTENTTRFFEPAYGTTSKTDELASTSKVQK
jgi:hypothetical protein